MDYERRFRRAGLPLFIEDYSAAYDVFTRATPVLTLVFLAEMLGAIDADWSTLANVGATVGGLAVLLAVVALVNRLRGRPPSALPERVGRTELALFVLTPALLPLIFGGQVRSAVGTIAFNAALLLLVYLVIGYGLFSILRGTGEDLGRELVYSLFTLARAIPLLLLFAVVIFMTVETWEVFTQMPDPFLLLLAAVVVGFGVVFLIAQLPAEVRRLETSFAAGHPLSRRQRVNVALIIFISHALQVLVVTAAMGAAFVGFGLLAIPPGLQEEWSGVTIDVLATFELFGHEAYITSELLRVAGAVAGLSGLYYAIAVLTDSTYRDHFLDRLSEEMREVFADRARYLDARSATASSTSGQR